MQLSERIVGSPWADGIKADGIKADRSESGEYATC